MPVGAWELEFGCNTLADPLRVSQYVTNAQDPAYCTGGVNALAPVAPAWTNLQVFCNCDALRYTASEVGATPTSIPAYTTPELDAAPWYTSLIPESRHFWGFILEKAEDVSTAPIKRNVSDRVTAMGGATLGQLRKGGRVMKFTLLAFGAYDSAMDYGFRWLGDQLVADCSQCELCDLTVRTSCPTFDGSPTYQEWDTGRWTFKDVGIVDGPRYEDPPTQGASCNVRRISFTMVAGSPYAFKCPLPILSDITWIPDLYGKSTVVDDAQLWLDAKFSVDDEQTVTNKGTIGSVGDATYGSSGVADGADPLLLTHTGTSYLYLPGTAGNTISTPASAALNITGPLEMIGRWSGNLAPASEQSLVSKGSNDYGTVVTTDGKLGLRSHDSAATVRDATSTVAIPYSSNTTFWWKVAVVPSTGKVYFYTAPDSSTVPTTWNPLGTTVTLTAYASGTLRSTGSDLVVSGQGKHYRTLVYSGGLLKFDSDYSKFFSGGQTTLTDSSSFTAVSTVARSTTGIRSVVVTRSVWIFDGATYLTIPDDPLLDRTATDSLTVVALVRSWIGGDQFLVGKKNSLSGSGAGYMLTVDPSNDANSRLSDSIHFETNTATLVGPGTNRVFAMTRNADTHILSTYINDGATTFVTSTPEPDSTVDLSNSLAFRVGNDIVGTHGYTGEISAVLVWNRALTAGEISEVSQMLVGGAYSYCPPISWICEDNPSVCSLVTNEFGIGEDAIVIEVHASKAIQDLLITVTPDTFGFACDPATAPLDFIAPDPCDSISVPYLPAGYTLRYDTTTQRITVTLPGGEVRDGTPYIDTAADAPPSFPVIRCGTFCVCVSSARCSWNADPSTVNIWTVHRELVV